MKIEWTDRTAATVLYEEESSVPAVPRVGDDVEIADTAYVVNAVIWVPDAGRVQVRCR